LTLPTSSNGLEILHPGASARKARVALFDFDGTLSLIRAGWANVMLPMMVEELSAQNSGESEAELAAVAREFVDRLTGKQTIYQMIELARQVELRGGTPKDPLVYKHRYLDLLHERIKGRLKALETGAEPPETYLVPGSIALLEALRARGLKLYLASGTDEPYMKREADLLQVTRYFNGGVFGALDNYKTFSKKILIDRIITSSECRGDEFLAFGDGYVEIENIKGVGGVAVGVATEEEKCLTVDAWKRNRLAGVGADYIMPNYLALQPLLDQLFG
jgi:phosphoglycolate phosphatase-like HAD superfamily hydrolase